MSDVFFYVKKAFRQHTCQQKQRQKISPVSGLVWRPWSLNLNFRCTGSGNSLLKRNKISLLEKCQLCKKVLNFFHKEIIALEHLFHVYKKLVQWSNNHLVKFSIQCTKLKTLRLNRLMFLPIYLVNWLPAILQTPEGRFTLFSQEQNTQNQLRQSISLYYLLQIT